MVHALGPGFFIRPGPASPGPPRAAPHWVPPLRQTERRSQAGRARRPPDVTPLPLGRQLPQPGPRALAQPSVAPTRGGHA